MNKKGKCFSDCSKGNYKDMPKVLRGLGEEAQPGGPDMLPRGNDS